MSLKVYFAFSGDGLAVNGFVVRQEERDHLPQVLFHTNSATGRRLGDKRSMFGGSLNWPQVFLCYSIVTVFILRVNILLNFIVGSKNDLLLVQKSVIFRFMYCH